VLLSWSLQCTGGSAASDAERRHDVFATARRQDMPIVTLAKGEDELQNWYSLVLIE
jgi:hypothetical protein